ncbi:MAG: toprim domain-containing protein [Patescibacteria group bacterium]
MSPIDKLTEYFSLFPGIGMRQARRFVYFLLRSDAQVSQEIASLIQKIKEETAQCSSCYRFFEPKDSLPQCNTCLDPVADEKLLLIVEKDQDLDAIRKSGMFNGKYFVLGGLIPIGAGKRPKHLKDKELFMKISKETHIQEVVLALSAHPEGDVTSTYIKEQLFPIGKKRPLRVTTLGRGISTGTELEYSDTDTIAHALGNRK